jgi:alkylation response protein AidB-like acyl-CoA dehydrogenase
MAPYDIAEETRGDDDAFRREVADFLQTHWVNGDRDAVAFRKAATERGYLYRNVPVKYGGSGQAPSPIKAHIIREAFSRVRAPRELPGRAIDRLVPTLLAVGEDWQKDYFIPRTISGEFSWCQGYSEPGAGSDLASLRTKARLEGDEWIINGQKVWTSDAFTASHMFMLARTEDKPKHAGISYLLLNMRQPGVKVRPLKQITGESHFNEVFFDDARTPKDWIVGKRGEGWLVSRATLAFERAGLGSADGSQALFDRLLKLAKSTPLNGRPAIQDPLIRDEMGQIQAMVAAHKAEFQDQLHRALRGETGAPGEGAFAKLFNSTIAEKIALVARKIIGATAMASPSADAPGAARWVNQYMNSIAAQIGGGTSNMQRNIIAERVLGLPRDDIGA